MFTESFFLELYLKNLEKEKGEYKHSREMPLWNPDSKRPKEQVLNDPHKKAQVLLLNNLVIVLSSEEGASFSIMELL